MAERLQAPKGTYDVLPDQAAARRLVERSCEEILGGAGFRRVETPIFEHTELFARGVGDATDIVSKEMYTFEDAGDRSLTLRPEGTAPIMRAYHEHGLHKEPQPVKLWYFGPFFRRERPQAGRFRQFWQVGAETIGSDDPSADAESIVLLQAILSALGVQGARLRLATLGTPERRAGYRELLVAYLREHEDRLSDEVRSRIDQNPLRAFDADHPGTREVMAGAPLLIDHLDQEDLDHFAEVRERLDAAGIAYEVDPTLVRGLDYYTRTLFEFTSDALGAQSGVGGGGRYDRLAEQLGNKPTPGVGFAAGIERLLLAGDIDPIVAARAAERPVDVYIAADGAEAFALAQQARAAGLTARLDLAGRSAKGATKQAARLGARHLVLSSDTDMILKDMESTEEAAVAAGEIVSRILRERHAA
ncbi:MAG: histidine--tRNA ligase [Baekduia sp.]